MEVSSLNRGLWIKVLIVGLTKVFTAEAERRKELFYCIG